MHKIAKIKDLTYKLANAEYDEEVLTLSILKKVQEELIKDPSYHELWKNLDKKSKGIREDAIELYKAIREYNRVISFIEVDNYDQAFNNLKEKAYILYRKIVNVDRATKNIIRYVYEETEKTGFTEKHREYLPKTFNIEYGKQYNEPLTSFEFYSDLHYSLINIGEKSINAIKSKLIKRVKLYYEVMGESKQEAIYSAKSYIDSHENDIVNNFRQSIVNGSLIQAQYRKPRNPKNIKDRGPLDVPWGSIVILVKTDKFDIPGEFNIQAQALVELIDEKKSQGREKAQHELTVRYIHKLSTVSLDNLSDYKEDTGKIYSPPEVDIKESNSSNKMINKYANQVPRKYIQISEVDFAEAMREGYRKVFGEDPSAEILGIGWAQAVLESGRPIKLPANNVGNIKATKDWINSGKPYSVMTTSENKDDGTAYKHKNAEWRAYDTPADGAAGYWSLIGRKYKETIPWMKAGDADSAMVVMRFKGYYTTKVSHYAGAVGKLYKEFMDKIAPQLSGLESIEAEPPSDKLPVKDWIKDYNREEIKDALLKSRGIQEDNRDEVSSLSNESSILKEIDDLIEKLMSEGSNSLEMIIKTAIANSKLPTSDVLVIISSNTANYSEKLEYSRVTARLLKKTIDSDVTIHGDNNNIELYCITKGSEKLVENAVQAICDCVAKGMLIKANVSITPTVLSGMLSKFSEINHDNIIKNYRLFNMNRISNG